MRKILTLLAALACTAALNAATLEWTVEDLGWTTKENNQSLNVQTFTLDDYIDVTFGDGTGTSGVIYRNTTGDKVPYITVYSQNTMSIKATNALITSVTFIVDQNSDDAQTTQTTPGWKVKIGSATYSIDSPTWTGNSTTVEVIGNSKTVLLGLNIEYTVDNPTGPSNPADFETAELFFSADQVGTGAEVFNVSLSDNGTSVDFNTNSTSANIAASNGYFGTAEDYITLPYRYQPGGKSSNGVNSTNKGVFTFPCAGTLIIYASNNQAEDRNLQLVQNDVTIFDSYFKSTDAVNPPNSTRNVYPVVEVEVSEGSAYLLWPTNQVALFGFKFVPTVNSITEGDITLSAGADVDQTNQSAVVEDGTLVISTVNTSALAYIQVPETAIAVYYTLTSNTLENVKRKAAPEGFKTASKSGNYYVISLLANTQGSITVQYEEEDGTLSDESIFNYKVDTNVPTGIEEVVECLPAEDGIIYNIFGQKVDESYKGIVIKNGRKYIQK